MMKNIKADKQLIAACGLYCGACRKYLAGKCAVVISTKRLHGAKSELVSTSMFFIPALNAARM